jgi:hypothetical protein
MGQVRNKTGFNFEKVISDKFYDDGWILKPKSPKMVWSPSGKDVFLKMANVGYDPQMFLLDKDKSNLDKYDIYNLETNEYYEIKKYSPSKFKNWVMLSEPYFKVCTKKQLPKISNAVYNNFVNLFFEYNQSNGLLDYVQNEIVKLSSGIICDGGIIRKEDLEYRTRLKTKQWGDYNRITIEMRLK